MAEGLLRRLAPERFEVESAGTEATGVHPLAIERCPLFPGRTQRVHWSFEDPSAAPGSEAERLAVFRRVRDAIAAQLRRWLAEADR